MTLQPGEPVNESGINIDEWLRRCMQHDMCNDILCHSEKGDA